MADDFDLDLELVGAVGDFDVDAWIQFVADASADADTTVALKATASADAETSAIIAASAQVDAETHAFVSGTVSADAATLVGLAGDVVSDAETIVAIAALASVDADTLATIVDIRLAHYNAATRVGRTAGARGDARTRAVISVTDIPEPPYLLDLDFDADPAPSFAVSADVPIGMKVGGY